MRNPHIYTPNEWDGYEDEEPRARPALEEAPEPQPRYTDLGPCPGDDAAVWEPAGL